MAYPPYLRDKARMLRKEKRLTIDELAERLAVSRTTIYFWVGDISIPKTEKQIASHHLFIAQRRGTKRMQAKYRRLREAAYDEGIRMFPLLEQRRSFRDFVVMYMAEGYKRDRNQVALGNSDPAIIALANRWINGLAQRPPTYSFQYHADQDPDELRSFWASTLGIEADRIAAVPKSNSGRLSGRVWRCKYGVFQVRASDTLLRAELEAWMDWIRDEWD